MNGPVAKKRTIRWTSSPHPLPRPPRPRPRRRFAFIAVSSTLVACSLAAGIAVFGMKRNAAPDVTDSMQPLHSDPTHAMASAQTSGREPERIASRLKAPAQHKGTVAPRTAPEPPATDHPRWQQAFAALGPAVSEKSAVLRRKLISLGRERMESKQSPGHAGAETAPVASILGQTAYAEVSAAETADEIAALEAIVVPDEPKAVEERDAPAQPPVSWETEASNMRRASASEAVNLRAQPGTEGRVLAVVPAGAQIEASADCTSWCAVSYDGRHGWIFKDYIRFNETASVAPETHSGSAQVGEPQRRAEKPLPPPTRANTTLERTRSSR